MRDITTTSFGLVIAYLLPGMVGLYSLTFWSPKLQAVFKTFLTTAANVGLFLLVILGALVVGLLVNSLRWVLYEKWICRSRRLTPEDFAVLGDEAKLAAFRAAVDENFRYHQFGGNMNIVLIPLYVGAFMDFFIELGLWSIAASAIVFVALEVVVGMAAVEAYDRYIARTRKALKGG